jgi:hypothetical protein
MGKITWGSLVAVAVLFGCGGQPNTSSSSSSLSAPTVGSVLATPGRAPPLRDPNELAAPWEVVNLAENGHPTFYDYETRTQPWLDPSHGAPLEQQVGDFMHFGKSSLTPYEASVVGLSFDDPSSSMPTEPIVVTDGQFVLGDRVSFHRIDSGHEGEQGQGIVTGINYDPVNKTTGPIGVSVDVPTGTLQLGSQISIDGITASALDDGRRYWAPNQLTPAYADAPNLNEI